MNRMSFQYKKSIEITTFYTTDRFIIINEIIPIKVTN